MRVRQKWRIVAGFLLLLFHAAAYSINPAIDPEQRQAIDELARTTGENPTVYFDERHGTPSFIRATDLSADPTGPQRQLATDPKARAQAFLLQNKNLLKLRAPLQELRLRSDSTDSYKHRHLTYEQLYQGIPVWGQQLKLHYDASGRLRLFNGNFIATPENTPTQAGITADYAAQIVAADLNQTSLAPEWILNQELVLWPQKDTALLAYYFDVRPAVDERFLVFVDAQSGVILQKLSGIHSQAVSASSPDMFNQTQTFTAWQQNGTFYMVNPDVPGTATDTNPLGNRSGINDTYIYTGKNTTTTRSYVTDSNNTNWDPVAVTAMVHTLKVYDYFKNNFQRNSLDNANMSLKVVVHYDDNYANAFWNGSEMTYGDGFGNQKSLAACLDIAAHEMTHGVIENTAKLQYVSQSGALNESFADVFGILVENKDWTMGEGCFNPAIRDFIKPENGQTRQPSKMSAYRTLPVTKAGDYGGVHINSGIPNHAAYLTAQTIDALGKNGRDAIGKIYYLAVTDYLTPSAQFVDARKALEQAAEVIYGVASAEKNAVSKAWDAVEVFNEGGPIAPPPDTTAPIDGADVMLYLQAKDGTANGAGEDYRAWLQILQTPFSANTKFELTGTQAGWPLAVNAVYSRTAVYSADAAAGGGNCVECHPVPNSVKSGLAATPLLSNLYFFIGKDGAHQSIFGVEEDANPFIIRLKAKNNTGEQVNVNSIAISPDGRFFATVTDEIFLGPDNKQRRNRVRVTQLIQRDNHQLSTKVYTLESPSFSDTQVLSNTLLYAENIAFDFTGDYLLFEAVNCLDAPDDPCTLGGGGQRFRTVGYLNLINESVSYLFPNQNPDIDYRNPTFAANNNFMLALDRIDRSAAVTDAALILFDREKNAVTDKLPWSNDHIQSGIWSSAGYWGDHNYVSYVDVTGTQSSIKRMGLDETTWTLDRNSAETVNQDNGVAYPLVYRVGIRHYRRVDVDRAFINFGEVLLNTAGSGQTLVLRNRGNENIAINFQSLDNSAFSSMLENNATQIPAYGEVNLTLGFHPTQLQPEEANLTIHVDGEPAFINVAVNGIGVTVLSENAPPGPGLPPSGSANRENKVKDYNRGLGSSDMWLLLCLSLLVMARRKRKR